MMPNNHKKNRRGQMTDIGLAILAIVALVIFSLFLYKSYIDMRERLAIQDCKNSIMAHSILLTGTSGSIAPDIKCPTREVTIKDKDLKNAKNIIAEDMHRCWYEWNRGDGRYFQGDGVFCHICSIYTFNDKNQKIEGFMNYLSTSPIKVKYPGDTAGLAYMDYFQGYTTPKSAEIANQKIQDVSKTDIIDTSQKYASIFVYASGKDAIYKALEGGNRGTLLAIGGIAGVGGAVAAVALVSNPAGWVVLGVGVAFAGGYLVYEALTGGDSPEWISYISFRPYNTDELKALGCEKLDVNQMSGKAQG